MKEIHLTQGKVAFVDDEDYEWLSLCSWYFSGPGYAARDITRNKKKTCVYMHRLILDVPEDKKVDHIDGNRLNNTRSNLRVCIRMENAANTIPRQGCSSKYKGVYWDNSRGHYRVEIQTKSYGKVYLGAFYSENEAGLAYNLAAKRLHREFAKLNEIPPRVVLPFKFKVSKSQSSKHTGVSFDKSNTGKWYAYIDSNGKRLWCKRFNSEEAAYHARQEKLIALGMANKKPSFNFYKGDDDYEFRESV